MSCGVGFLIPFVNLWTSLTTELMVLLFLYIIGLGMWEQGKKNGKSGVFKAIYMLGYKNVWIL